MPPESALTVATPGALRLIERSLEGTKAGISTALADAGRNEKTLARALRRVEKDLTALIDTIDPEEEEPTPEPPTTTWPELRSIGAATISLNSGERISCVLSHYALSCIKVENDRPTIGSVLLDYVRCLFPYEYGAYFGSPTSLNATRVELIAGATGGGSAQHGLRGILRNSELRHWKIDWTNGRAFTVWLYGGNDVEIYDSDLAGESVWIGCRPGDINDKPTLAMPQGATSFFRGKIRRTKGEFPECVSVRLVDGPIVFDGVAFEGAGKAIAIDTDAFRDGDPIVDGHVTIQNCTLDGRPVTVSDVKNGAWAVSVNRLTIS